MLIDHKQTVNEIAKEMTKTRDFLKSSVKGNGSIEQMQMAAALMRGDLDRLERVIKRAEHHHRTGELS